MTNLQLMEAIDLIIEEKPDKASYIITKSFLPSAPNVIHYVLFDKNNEIEHYLNYYNRKHVVLHKSVIVNLSEKDRKSFDLKELNSVLLKTYIQLQSI